MDMNSDHVLYKMAEIGWVRTGDVVYVTLPAQLRPFAVLQLSETGSAIWELVDGRRRISGIVAETARQWGIDEKDVADAVTSFADALVTQNVLGIRPE
ncbi:hypothetical protein BJP65_06515 [Microbacterium sp. BH-3-3-3]|nr:hypothetical protein BJP65_06515 [Microbacterium sp. BH-3-3-3]